MANTAKIVLKADSSGIRKGTDDLRDLDRQAGRTETAAGGLKQSFGKLKVAAVAAGAAFAALGAVGLRAVIKNTIAQQNAVAQLNSSLQSTGRYTDEASAALQAHAAALQQTSTFGDEAIITAQSMLLTFKQLGGDVLPRTTQAVLDMSVKMGTDLKSSAIQLGKALNDPITGLSALSRVGVTFSESQKKVIKNLTETGRLAEAQALILDELETEFGGAAKAARNTLGGALDAVKNNFGDLLEVSGDKSSGVVGSINDLADILADPNVKQGFQTMAEGVLSFASALAQVPGFIGFVTDELAALGGYVDNDDFVRLTEKADSLRKGIENLTDAGAKGKILRIITPGDEQEVERLRQELRNVQNLLDEIEQKRVDIARGTAPKTAAQTVADNVAPVGGSNEPVEVDTSALDKEEAAHLKEVTAALKDRLDATDELRESLRAFAAEQGGPVVEAQQRYEDQLAEIDALEKQLLETGGLTAEQQADLQEARENALTTRQQTIDLINAEAEALANLLTPTEEVIAGIRLEAEMIGLSNIERAKRLALIDAGVEAGSADAAVIEAEIDNLYKLGDAYEVQRYAAESFADAGARAFGEWLDGTKSLGEAFSDMARNMLKEMAQLILKQAILAAFGMGGGTGGSFSLAAAFGGGRATGGAITAGTPYMVGEMGPELIVPRQDATVIPNNKLEDHTPTSRNQTTNITVNLPPTVQRRTATQTANEIAAVQKRASARNG